MRSLARRQTACITYLFFSAQADPPRRARVAPTPARDRFDPRSRWSCRRSSRKRRDKTRGKGRLDARKMNWLVGRNVDVGVWRDNSRLFARAQNRVLQHRLKAEKRRTKARACVLFLYRSADDGDGGDDGDDGVGEGNGGRHSRAWHGGEGRRRGDEVKSPRDTKRDWLEDPGTPGPAGRSLADNDASERAIGLVAGRLCQSLGQSGRSAAKVTTAGAKFNLRARTICSAFLLIYWWNQLPYREFESEIALHFISNNEKLVYLNHS